MNFTDSAIYTFGGPCISSHFTLPTLLANSFMVQKEVSNGYKGWIKDSVFISRCSTQTNSGKLNRRHNACPSPPLWHVCKLWFGFSCYSCNSQCTSDCSVTFLKQHADHYIRTQQNEKFVSAEPTV